MPPEPVAPPTSPRDRIRAAGFRATKARITVLAALDGAAAPLSHAELLAVLGPGWDRATVYRNLSDLTERGLLVQVDLGDGVQRYEVRAPQAHAESHPHFVCVDCGNVQCLDDVQVTLSGPALPPAIAEADVSVRISGHCDDCR